MIRALSWFAKTTAGVLAPNTSHWQNQSPANTSTESVLTLLNHPIKYFSRMTPESQLCLCAAILALHPTPWLAEKSEIGLLAAGIEGTLTADREYFTDYLANGRTLGRANLFVYTLPTSAASAVSIALGLTGPALHVQSNPFSLASLISQAQQMLADGEAAAMLALWSDPQAAICLAIDAAPGSNSFPTEDREAPSPLHFAETLHRTFPP